MHKNKWKQYFRGKTLLIVVVLLINTSSFSIEDMQVECSQECVLINEFHINQCAFIGRKGDNDVGKKCFDITQRLWDVSGDQKYLLMLADHYVEGIGVAKEITKGLIFYKEVANSVSEIASQAQAFLGAYYMSKKSVNYNLNKAKYWLKKAAYNNVDEAQCNYAELLKSLGKHKASWYWYKKAAANNSKMAKYKLANFVREGYNIGINRKEAYKLLHSISDQNFEPAFQTLGIMYEEDGNKEKANYWYCKFANSEFLKKMNSGMSSMEALIAVTLDKMEEQYLIKVKNEQEKNEEINKKCDNQDGY